MVCRNHQTPFIHKNPRMNGFREKKALTTLGTFIPQKMKKKKERKRTKTFDWYEEEEPEPEPSFDGIVNHVTAEDGWGDIGHSSFSALARLENDMAGTSDANRDLRARNEMEVTEESLPTEYLQGSSQPAVSKQPSEEEGIHYFVSSRHLKNASPQFRRMMTGGKWKEGIREDNGLFQINTTTWGTEAFLIFLNVLHLRNLQVPRVVSLEMMAKIAALIDFYECQEAIDV